MATYMMGDATRTTAPQTSILDLPEEILLDIFGCFDSEFPVHDPSEYRKPQATAAKDRLESLGTKRLVCRTFNRLISPLLCPVVSLSLCSGSIDRLEGLSRNPLIAQGIRGISISLLFRPRTIATDFPRYHAYAESLLKNLERQCDYYTEFQEYNQADISDDAIAWRNYHDAWTRFARMRSAWRGLLEARSSPEDGPQRIDSARKEDKEGKEGQEPGTDDRGRDVAEAQAILKSCFDKYAAAHADEARIISNGSFVRSVVRALSRCDSCPFVWFNEDQLGREMSAWNAITIATDESALVQTLTQGHDWLSIEESLCRDDDDAGLLFPASVLTELPVACHSAKLRLRGISVDCFPLLRGYRCLLSGANLAEDTVDSDHWAQFAAACQDLEIFNFGKRGMNCSPLPPARQSTSDLEIINGFIGAAISGPHLQRLHVNMTAFRVRQGRPEEEHLYPASPILSAIESTQLRNIILHNIDVCEQALLVLIKSASARHLTNLYLTGVTLSRGRYASAMSLLHEIVLSRKSYNGSTPTIYLSALQGAEFGEPSTFDGGNDWFWGTDEERDAFWDKLEKYEHPELLKQVEEWILDGRAGDVNPLL